MYFIYYTSNLTNNQENLSTSITSNIHKIKEEHSFFSITEFTIKIFREAKKTNIDVKRVLLQDSKLFLTLESKNKENIFTFLNIFKESSLDNIKFDETRKRYQLETSFRILRK